jgi:hypothetical protein
MHLHPNDTLDWTLPEAHSLGRSPEELSRPVEVTSPGADLARTCRRVHSSPSPEGLNRPEYDLNPIPAWVSAGRTARYLPALGSLARSDAPFSRASQKRRGDLRCARETKVPNLGSGAPPRLGLRKMNRECREPDAPSFSRQHQRWNPLCSGAPDRLSHFIGTSPVTSCDDIPPVSPPLRTAAAREPSEVEQVSRRPRAQLAGASLRSPRRRPTAEGARRTSPAQPPNCFLKKRKVGGKLQPLRDRIHCWGSGARQEWLRNSYWEESWGWGGVGPGASTLLFFAN